MANPNESLFGPRYLPGHTVRVIRADGEAVVMIKAVRAMPSHEHDFGSLTAGTASTRQECTHLELEDGQMAQYWVRVRDQFEVEIRHSRATEYFGSRLSNNSVGGNWRVRPFYQPEPYETEEILNYRLLSSEFWVWEQQTPLFDLYPYNSAQNPQGHLEFMGWRYAVEPTDQTPVATLRVDIFEGK